jgi:hypothetical protein
MDSPLKLVQTQHELHGHDELGCVWMWMQSGEESGIAELLEEGVALRVASIRATNFVNQFVLG